MPWLQSTTEPDQLIVLDAYHEPVAVEPDCERRRDPSLLFRALRFASPFALLTKYSCLYINKLADVDESVLRALMQRCWAHMQAKYG